MRKKAKRTAKNKKVGDEEASKKANFRSGKVKGVFR